MERWKTFWVVVFLATIFGFVKPQKTVCREASVGDVVFLVDTNIRSAYAPSMRNFLSNLVMSLNVSRETIRVGLVLYSDAPQSEFLLSTYKHKSEMLKHIRGLQFKSGGNKMGLALQFLLDQHFQEASGSRPGQGVPRVAVVISSRAAEDQVQEPAEALKRAGILLYTVGIKAAVLAELKEIASSPAEKFVSYVPNFPALRSLLQKLPQELCDTLAKAVKNVDQVSPACREAVLADIVFLVDSSTSIGPQNFQKVRNFLYSVVSGLDISSDRVRVALAQYNDNIYPAFTLNQYFQKSVVLEQIQNLPYRTGGTNTGSALEFIRTNYLTEAAGSRAKDRVPQVVILLTDGESNDEVEEAADRLKEDGVVVYVVGINVQDIQELQKIASEPFEKFLFNTENFHILQDFSGSILQTLCSAVQGKIKEFTKTYADVVFLADTSQATSQASFQWMKTFISRVVSLLDVGRDKYQIGLAQYGDHGYTEFLFNSYQTKEQILAHIQRRFVLLGGYRWTGRALQFLNWSFFKEAAGSRIHHGVPQYAVVLTSGKSFDEMQDAAQSLREKGVKVISVGIQDFDRRELEKMGSSSSLVYEMKGQDGIEKMIQDVAMVIQGIQQQGTGVKAEEEKVIACPIPNPTDLVFLIEEFSSGRQSSFQQVVSFLKTTVNSLRIHPDVVRMALVFYSGEPRLEFSLNAFQNRAQILERLDRLTYRARRGRAKAGTALDFLRNNVFIQEKGSRPQSDVLQVAVVIAEGSSQDNVSRPASLLRRAGVTIYTAGAQLASKSKDLEKMASYPPWKYATPLESFLQLSVVGNMIKNQICHKIVDRGVSISSVGSDLQEVPGCVQIGKADIYFLIDGSGSINPEDFQDMKEFMNKMIEMFQVGPDGVRFGAVQYSDGESIHFFLNNYSTVETLKVAVDNIQQRGGGTLTGQALTAMAGVFAKTARSNVSHYLIVITDGESSDLVAKPAETLKEKGVIIYAIGVENANKTQLEEMAGDKSFFVHNFDGLKAIQQEVVKIMCSSEACKNRKADIIFLIAGSKSISRKDFEKMKEIVRRVVNQSSIGADEIRIGLLLFSSYPREEFRLNQYFSKVDIHRAISNIQQMGDGTHTGKALNFALPFFESSRGGRPGIHQYLIVITDKGAQDDVVTPAKALRDRSIVIFAIGVGGARYSAELQEITNDEHNVYCEEKFESLLNLERDILYKICTTPNEPPAHGCDIDLSVGIDITAPTRQVQQKLQRLLPDVMQHLTSLSSISCNTHGQINTMFRYLVPGLSGQLAFDSGFEEFSEEIIQKFLDQQAAKSSRMDVDFLQSLGAHAFRLSSAKVKVLLVFTDGLDDDLERMKKTSKLLRIKGFSGLLIVGLEGVQKLEELQELEFGRGFAYTQPLSITLHSLPDVLLKQLDTIVERTCCNIAAKCFGEDGPRGIFGGFGNKGEKGYGGLPGYPGEEGGHGERGPRGLPGLRGEDGCPGIKGPKGERGFSGEKGNPGEEGLDGLDGEQGSPGVPGLSGEKGNQGNRGLAGPPGYPGEQGEPGLRGEPGDPGINSYIRGPKGEKGRLGHQGRTSFDGPQGETGNVGLPGSRGRRGLPGMKGVRGESGYHGFQGERGQPGSQGQRGRQGAPGLFGQKGLLGPQGNPGPPGPNGSKGKAGLRGMKGEVGYTGEKGPRGRQGARGQPGLFGPDGFGRPGRKGLKGEPGFPGFPGAPGEDGNPGHKGEKGTKGIRGIRGSAGFPGLVGTPGDQGPPGPMGIKGPKGLIAKTPCEIVAFTREKCPCSRGLSKCPVFPTEVVFALDMSSRVSLPDFERMRGILLSLLRKMEISESNCPTGARVAIVSYNDKISYLVRFADYKGKSELLLAVRKIPLERSTASRKLGDAMRFVARHLFKRVRSGLLLRKVAVFFQTGWAQDADTISTASLELSALDITPIVISFTDAHNLPDALLMGGANRFHLFIWETQGQQDLESMLRCTLCYDKCQPHPECGPAAPRPLAVDVDLAFLVDSSLGISTDVYRAALNLVAAVLEDLEVATQPSTSFAGARAALVTYTVPGFWPGSAHSPVLKHFHLTTYNQRAKMQRQVLEAAGNLLQGAPALGHALEWTIDNVLLEAPLSRKTKVLYAIVASETSNWDREKLRTLSLEAKCKGITLFVLALGPGVGMHELAELAHVASAPLEQHLLRLEGVSHADMAYARGFTHAFLNLLKSETNQYPPPELAEECGDLNRGDTRLRSITSQKRSSQQLDIAVFAEELKAAKGTDFFQEEDSRAVTPSITLQKAPDVFRKNDYKAKDSEQERLTSQKEAGKEANSGTDDDACSMDPMGGKCQQYTLKWYYDRRKHACNRFWYGGCGGNANQFDTKKECEARCVSKPF